MPKMTTFLELSRLLDEMASLAREIDGTPRASLSDLLTPEFLAEHTRFSSVIEMFSESGFRVESNEDFAAIPDARWDAFVRSVSSFENWQAMLDEAGAAWAMRVLKL